MSWEVSRCVNYPRSPTRFSDQYALNPYLNTERAQLLNWSLVQRTTNDVCLLFFLLEDIALQGRGLATVAPCLQQRNDKDISIRWACASNDQPPNRNSLDFQDCLRASFMRGTLQGYLQGCQVTYVYIRCTIGTLLLSCTVAPIPTSEMVGYITTNR